MMFAVITPALITGAFVERVKFKSFLLFSLLWATLVYDPLCHWVWGQGGWLKEMGVLDFAGGTVVHIAAGFSALAFALVIGPRKGHGSVPMEPNNIPLTVLGTGLLWVGWFGFNAGSALAANGVAVNALVTTNTSAATAGLVWMLLSWLDGRPSTLGIATGMVVGLAAVTPACGYVTPLGAMVIGAVAAPLSYYAMRFRERRKLDESLDVWACHGMASTWGTIATGLFATVAVNADGANGLFFGNPAQAWHSDHCRHCHHRFFLRDDLCAGQGAEYEHRIAGKPDGRRSGAGYQFPRRKIILIDRCLMYRPSNI